MEDRGKKSLNFNAQNTHLVMFDLDGTLIDSVPDIAIALDETMVAMGYFAPGEAQVRHWVGNGSYILIRRALAAASGVDETRVDQSLLDRAQLLFFDYYELCCDRLSQLYPGVKQSLDFLIQQQIILTCVTNKPARFTQKVLASCGIDQYFSLQVSGDTLANKKPDPQPLLHVLEHFKVSREQSLMVGDSLNDIQAARAAGVAVLGVDYGYNHGQAIYAADRDGADNPDWVVSDLSDYFSGH